MKPVASPNSEVQGLRDSDLIATACATATSPRTCREPYLTSFVAMHEMDILSFSPFLIQRGLDELFRN